MDPHTSPTSNTDSETPLLFNELRLIPALINRVEKSGEVSNEIVFLPLCNGCGEPITRFAEANIVTLSDPESENAPLQSLGTIDGASLDRLPGKAIALHKACDRDGNYPWAPLDTILKSDQRRDFEKPIPSKPRRSESRNKPHIEFHLDPRNPNAVRSDNSAIRFRVIARQGRTEFDADFFSTNLQLAPKAAELIKARWDSESEGKHWPKMKCGTGKTHIAFSAPLDRQNDWRKFLTETLSKVDAWQLWVPAHDAFVPMTELEDIGDAA